MTTQIRPWYKEFWAWFLLGILGLAVVMGTTFLVFSITSFDGMVVDDYYKEGLAINKTLKQDQRAAEMGMAANLRIDDLSGDVVVKLEGEARPEKLQLDLIFPSQDGRDQRVILDRVSAGHYVGQLPRALQYRWYVQLHAQTAEPEWRLLGEIELPQKEALALRANIGGA
ncbi:FixH family protein [Halomonas sp. M20]|uniref:FixH family protein n=1 Tax=Halomonas sp. M20 TaxID=2763264 RepID=UPI001D09E2E6|nr:FixH family protein [Halomonas sp. M20]